MSKQQNRTVAIVGALSAVLAAGGTTVFASQTRPANRPQQETTKPYHVSLKSLHVLNQAQSGKLVTSQHQATVPTETSEATMKPAVKAVNKSVKTSSKGAYTVQSGDTLWTISEQLQVSVHDLMATNQLKNSVIHSGQTLQVPETAGLTAAEAAANTEAETTAEANAAAEAQAEAQAASSAEADSTQSTVADSASSDQQPTATSAAVTSAASATAQPAATAISFRVTRQSAKAISLTTTRATRAAVTPVSTTAQPSTSQATSEATPTPTLADSVSESTNAVAPQVVNAAHTYADQGVSSVQGGASTAGMDASGLVQQAYAQADVTLPHNTVDQEAYFTSQSVSAAQPGDVLFWGNQGQTYHEAIYVGGSQYVSASETGTTVQTYTMDGQTFMPSFSGTLRQ
ncbi:NlpC/P60 family protein [Furfurilactobacillus sp. WILCCON 0119]